MIDSGLGERQVNSFLSMLDVPTVSQTTLKKYERFVGLGIEEVARDSCLESIRIEKQMTIDANEKENT